MSRPIIIALFFLTACGGTFVYGSRALIDKLENKYFSVLDEWVQRGGKAQDYQSEVLETCGKLVVASATISEALTLPIIQREEFDFRVNVCAKTTAHRVSPQPELNDQELVQEICDDTAIPVLGRLCRRSGLR